MDEQTIIQEGTNIVSTVIKWAIGTGAVGTFLGVFLTNKANKWSRSKQEKKSDEAKSITDMTDAGKAILGLTEEELRIREEHTKKAWETVDRLEGMIDQLVEEGNDYRRKIEEVSKELSNVKLELILTQEQKIIAERERDRYKNLLKELVTFFKRICPEEDIEKYIVD